MSNKTYDRILVLESLSRRPGLGLVDRMSDTLALAGLLTPGAADYAALLLAHDFTVYADPTNRRPSGWFHYSRLVDGRRCFGTFSDGSESFNGAYHDMPITPSRLNGSSAIIGSKRGDEETSGLDSIPVMSVAYARAVARPENWCPYNAEPTREATDRAATGQYVPKRFYRGATLPNAKPWGIGTHYLPITATTGEAF